MLCLSIYKITDRSGAEIADISKYLQKNVFLKVLILYTYLKLTLTFGTCYISLLLEYQKNCDTHFISIILVNL